MSQLSLKPLLKDSIIKSGWLSSASLVGLTLVLTGIFFWRLPPQIPLFYSLPESSPQLANRLFIWLIPALAILSLTGLTALFSFLLKRELVITRLLTWFSVLISLLFLIALIHIFVIIL